MVDNQEFNWEEVSSEVTSDVEKKNPIGNEQVTQLESQDGQPISSESDLGGQSTLPTDDKDKGVKYYTKTDKNGKTTYWKKDKWGEKAITKTTYDFENKKQVEDKMATNAEFTEVVPLDKQSDVDKMLQVDVPIAQEPKQPIELKVEEPKKEEDLSWFGDFAGRFDRAVLGLGADALKWIGIAASKIDKITGSEPNKKTEDYATYKWGQQLDEFIKDSFPTDVSRDEDFTSSIATGLGSIAGFAIAGPARTAFFGAASQSVPEYENAKQIVTDANSLTLDDFINKYTDPNADELSNNEIDANLEQQWFDLKGKNPEDVAFKSFIANSVIGASEALPINMAIGRIGKAGSSRFKDALVNAVSGGSEEAIQEGMTQYFSNLTTQQLLDENKNVLDGIAEATGTAFVLGGVLNGTLTALTGRYEQSEGKEKEELKSQIDRVKELQSRLPADGNETVVTLKSKEELQNDINEFDTKVNTHNEYVSNISNPDNLAKIASSISIDGGKLVEEFVNNVDDKVQKGYISTQQGEQAKQSLKTLLQANDKVPASIDNIEKRGQSVKLVAEKSILEEEIKDKDKALSAPQLERIKQINEELTNIALGKEPIVQEEVKAEEKTIEESKPQEALRDVESTTKALGGVDEANMAKIILPETQVKQKVYHGGESKIVGDFKNLNPNLTGFYFSSDIDNAKTYGNEIVEAYVDIKNPLIIDAKGLKFTDDIPVEAVFTYPNEKPYTSIINLPIDDVVYAVKNGKRPNQFFEIKNREKYDGVIFKNLIDPALTSRREIPQDTIVAFENSQIKRADNKSISEAYHKAKADGSNPELVKAVEDLLGKEQDASTKISRKEQLEKNLEEARKQFSMSSRSSLSSSGMQSIVDFAKYIKAWIELNGYRVNELVRDLRQYFGETEYIKQFKTDNDLVKHIEDVRQGNIEKESKKISPSLKKAQDWAFAEGRTVGAIEQAKLDSKEAKKVNREFEKERKEASKESQKLVDLAYDFGFAEGSEAGKFEQASKDYKEFEKEKKKLSKQEQERIDKAYKLGKTDGRRPGLEMIEVAKMIKDYINSDKEFKANINKSKNAKTILLNKVTKLIESTESKQSVKNKRLNDLLDYMDKLAEDGKYQDKLEEAQSIRKSIKSAIPKSDKSIPFDLKEMYRKLYSINPSKLSPLELDRYNNLMDDFTNKVMPKVSAGKYDVDVPSMNKINNAINVLYNGLNNRQTSAAYDPFNKVKSLGKKYLSEAEFNSLMNELDSGNITEEEFAKAVENRSNEFTERLNLDVSSKASELSDFMASEEAAGNMDDYSKAEKEVLKTYISIDPAKLSEADKLKYLFYAERIMTERNFIGSGIMANKIIGSKKKSAVTSMVDGIKNGLNGFERLVASRFATKEMFWKFATKTTNDAVKLREATGMSEVFNSSAEAKRVHEKFIAKYENIIDKWNKKRVDLREPVSIYKRGIYSKLIQYKENTTEGKDYAYNQGVEIIKSNYDSLLKSPSKRQRDKGALLKKAFDESGVEGKTRDEFIRDFERDNPAEVELVNEAKKFFDKYKERFRDVTEIYNNKSFDDWYEYTPTATEKIYAGEQVTPEEAKAKEFLSGYSKQTPLPGSIKERIPTASKEIAYDYNFDNVMSDKALDMLMYVYTQKDYQIANAVVNSSEVIDALGGAETHGILSRNLRDKIEADFGLDYESSDEATKYTRDLMKLGYNAVATTLGSVTQLPKQYIPAITDYFVTQGDFTLFAPSLNEAINLVAANGLREKGVQLSDKDVALLKLIDKFPIGERLRRNPNFDFQMSDNELSKISFSSADKKINWLKDKHRKMMSGVMASLRKSDNFAATQTWIAEYLKERKKKGVDISKIDWQRELENPDMEAANAAEMAVSTTQNVSDVSLGSRQMTKKQYNLSKQIFFNLASFALNAKARLYVDVRNLVTGSDPKIALRSLMGYSSQVAAYLVMSSIVKDGIEELSDLLFNPEDEEDKRRREKEEMEKSQEEKDLEKQRQEERDKKRLLTSIVNEAIFSGIPQDLVNLVYAGFNQLNAYTLSDDIEKLMTEIDSINEDIKKYPDDSNLKIDLNLKQKELEALVRSKDVINIFDQEGRNYGPISMYLGTGTKLFEKIEKANTIDDLTPREQKVLWTLIIGDALSLGMIDEGTWKSVRNKSWTKLKKQLEDKYGGKTITITTKPKKKEE